MASPHGRLSFRETLYMLLRARLGLSVRVHRLLVAPFNAITCAKLRLPDATRGTRRHALKLSSQVMDRKHQGHPCE